MHKLDLSASGLSTWGTVYHNLSYEEFFEHETSPDLESFARTTLTSSGALSVDTGVFTGRTPRAKCFVKEPSSQDNLWWAGRDRKGSDNKPIPASVWDHLKSLTLAELQGEDLYVLDGFAGTNPATRIAVRVICKVAWQAHFCKNMFIRPTEEELENFTPDWTILNAPEAECRDWESYEGLKAPEYAAFNIAESMTLIGGTWYGGEMKKGIFTMMNYFLPLKGVGAFHCSANAGEKGDTALFFGLSGTGKTTLSTDPNRALIGDDEHGWDDEGIFNFEGGCYAKTIDLNPDREPEIYAAIRRDALLENVVVDEQGNVDYSDGSKTANTRVSYPIHHIDNIVLPQSKGAHPKNIIFLTCDAFGVLPPVSKLTNEQAMYHYLVGYTAKVAGTEVGITEPQATFSSCFGAPFLSLHPTTYAHVLGDKMKEHGASAYLVNTGWSGGGYGVGERMSLKTTRTIINAILDGSIESSESEIMPVFNLEIPLTLPGLDNGVLNPRNNWEDKEAYDQATLALAHRFVETFQNYTDTPEGQAVAQVGPTV